MAMRTSLLGRIEIMADEAVVLTRYLDSAKIWTIGVGVTDAAGASIKPSSFTGRITLREAVSMFEKVLQKYENRVNRAVKVPLEQHEFDALVSFDYNTGAISRASLTKKLNAGDKAGAARGLLAWNKAGGKVSAGLVKRRAGEKHLFETGQYGDGRVNVYEASKAGKVLWNTGKRVNALELLGKQTLPEPVPEPRPVPVPLPPEKVEEVLREDGSVTINEADKVEKSFFARIMSLISSGVLSAITYLQGIDWRIIAVIAVAGLIAYGIYEYRSYKAAQRIKRNRVEDAITGKHIGRENALRKLVA